MRILQLSKHFPPYFGGIESVTYDLTTGLNNRNIKCDVLCANDMLKNTVDTSAGYTVWRSASFGKLFSTSIAPSLILQLSRIACNYDIIHIHFPDPMAAIALLLAKPKAKLVVHWHSDIVKQEKLLALYLPFQKKLLDRADIIVGTSQAYVSASLQLSDYLYKTVIVPIGIPTNKLFASANSVALIKNRFPGKKIVLALGRLIYYKGFEYLIKAAQHISNDTVIVIAGDGHLRRKLEQMIEELKLHKKVFLVGKIPQNELGNYFAASNLFCLPSIERSEAFGVVLLEAMQFGKPIVSTNITGSGVPWVNLHGVSGLNAQPANPVSLAEQINLLIGDHALCEKLGTNAKERFLKEFTVDLMIDHFQKIYIDLI